MLSSVPLTDLNDVDDSCTYADIVVLTRSLSQYLNHREVNHCRPGPVTHVGWAILSNADSLPPDGSFCATSPAHTMAARGRYLGVYALTHPVHAVCAMQCANRCVVQGADSASHWRLSIRC